MHSNLTCPSGNLLRETSSNNLSKKQRGALLSFSFTAPAVNTRLTFYHGQGQLLSAPTNPSAEKRPAPATWTKCCFWCRLSGAFIRCLLTGKLGSRRQPAPIPSVLFVPNKQEEELGRSHLLKLFKVFDVREPCKKCNERRALSSLEKTRKSSPVDCGRMPETKLSSEYQASNDIRLGKRQLRF